MSRRKRLIRKRVDGGRAERYADLSDSDFSSGRYFTDASWTDTFCIHQLQRAVLGQWYKYSLAFERGHPGHPRTGRDSVSRLWSDTLASKKATGRRGLDIWSISRAKCILFVLQAVFF